MQRERHWERHWERHLHPNWRVASSAGCILMASELGRSSRGAAYSMSCSTTVMATCPSEQTRVLKPVTSACTACESHSVEIFSQSAGTSAAAHAAASQRRQPGGRGGSESWRVTGGLRRTDAAELVRDARHPRLARLGAEH